MAPVSWRVALLLTVPALMWAGNAVVGRVAVAQVPPLLLNVLRWSLALLILLPLGWRAFGSPARRAQLRERWPHLAMLGLMGVGAYNALQYMALTTSSPMNVTLIAASAPVWVLAVGALRYGVKPQRRELIGAALSLAGVACVLSRGSLATLARVQLVPGDLLILLAIAFWAVYSWMLARPPASMQAPQRPDWNWAEFLCVQMVFGLVWAATAAGVEAVSMPTRAWTWTPGLLLALAFVAVGPSLLAYRAWGLGVAAAGPAMAAFFANLTPLFAALMSALWLGEPPRGYHALAFALIVSGIVVSSRRPAS